MIIPNSVGSREVKKKKNHIDTDMALGDSMSWGITIVLRCQHRSVAVEQNGSVSMSLAYITSVGHVDVSGMDCHQGPY